MPDMLRHDGGERSRLGRPALLLMLMAFLAYTYAIPRGPLANADTRVALTRAIVDDHTLRIDRYAAGLTDRSAYRGHFYTDKAPGASLLAVGYGFGTMAWALSALLFSHVLAAMSLFGAFMLLYPASVGRRPGALRRYAA